MSRAPHLQSAELAAAIRSRCARLIEAKLTSAHPDTLAVVDIVAYLGMLSLQGDTRAGEAGELLADDAELLGNLTSAMTAAAPTLIAAVAGLAAVLEHHSDELRHAVAFADDPAAAEHRRDRATAGLVARETLARLEAAARCLGQEVHADQLAEVAGRHDGVLRTSRLDLHGLQPVRSRLAEELGAAASLHWWLAASPDADDFEASAAQDATLPAEVADWLRSRLADHPDGPRLHLPAAEARALEANPDSHSFVSWMGVRLHVEPEPLIAGTGSEGSPTGGPGATSRIAERLAAGARSVSERLDLARLWRLPVPAGLQAWAQAFVPMDEGAVAAFADPPS